MNANDKQPNQGDSPQRQNLQESQKQQEQQSQEQRSGGGGQQQAQGSGGQQYGEGSYSGTRQYNEGLKDHVEHHDIERDARNAAPRNDAEAREMEEAERIGRSKSRGEGGTPTGK